MHKNSENVDDFSLSKNYIYQTSQGVNFKYSKILIFKRAVTTFLMHLICKIYTIMPNKRNHEYEQSFGFRVKSYWYTIHKFIVGTPCIHIVRYIHFL